MKVWQKKLLLIISLVFFDFVLMTLSIELSLPAWICVSGFILSFLIYIYFSFKWDRYFERLKEMQTEMVNSPKKNISKKHIIILCILVVIGIIIIIADYIYLPDSDIHFVFIIWLFLLIYFADNYLGLTRKKK